MNRSNELIIRADWRGSVGCLGALIVFVIGRLAILGDILFVLLLSLPLFIFSLWLIKTSIENYIVFSQDRICHRDGDREIVVPTKGILAGEIVRMQAFDAPSPWLLVLGVSRSAGLPLDPPRAFHKQGLNFAGRHHTVTLYLTAFSPNSIGLILVKVAELAPSAKITLLHRKINDTGKAPLTEAHRKAWRAWEDDWIKDLRKGVEKAGGGVHHAVDQEANREEWFLTSPEPGQHS